MFRIHIFTGFAAIKGNIFHSQGRHGVLECIQAFLLLSNMNCELNSKNDDKMDSDKINIQKRLFTLNLQSGYRIGKTLPEP